MPKEGEENVVIIIELHDVDNEPATVPQNNGMATPRLLHGSGTALRQRHAAVYMSASAQRAADVVESSCLSAAALRYARRRR